jgi:hypothetical protein
MRVTSGDTSSREIYYPVNRKVSEKYDLALPVETGEGRTLPETQDFFSWFVKSIPITSDT